MFYSHAIILITTLLSTAVKAHNTLSHPAPIRHKSNPNSISPDYNYKSPLDKSGSDFPCKGYHKLLDTPEGASVETWAAGSTQTWAVGDTVVHGGGSCQLSISEDVGATFKVIKSYIGNCPMLQKEYPFTVPKDAKSGKAIFAWTWFNRLGNREMYMNCAAVTITDGGAGLAAYPDIFKANIGNGCTTVDSTDVIIPNPGADVETDTTNSQAAPVGNCGASAPAPDPASPTSSAAATSSAVPAETSSAPAAGSSGGPAEGCQCTCGGPSGYIVNIVPAGQLVPMAEMEAGPSSTVTPIETAVSSAAAGYRRHRRWGN